MDDQNKNLILATALSFLVILVWFVLFPPPEPDVPLDAPTSQAAQGEDAGATAVPSAGGTADPLRPATETASVTEDAPRIDIETPRVSGSISLLGGRIDDLRLKDYRTSLEPDADIVTMLSPVGSDNAYYAVSGWAPGGGLAADAVPGPNTLWQQTGGDTLAVGSPVTLSWIEAPSVSDSDRKKWGTSSVGSPPTSDRPSSPSKTV